MESTTVSIRSGGLIDVPLKSQTKCISLKIFDCSHFVSFYDLFFCVPIFRFSFFPIILMEIDLVGTFFSYAI